jgi:hypothetical protein
MKVGQCGSQAAHDEVVCRRCRVVRAIAPRANVPQLR